MEPNYAELGLKCGLEIHQQLGTKKLFCSCPTEIRDDEPDFIVLRRLKASAGESGEIDVASEHEAARDKYFLYHGYYDSTCLVELDEEPIHQLNPEALEIALQVSLLVKAKIVDVIQVMRKTVIDGSNTSGFQRTALIARNGFINVNNKKISVPIICLEEEAAKIVARYPDHDIYNLSRLGIPLIEISTGPELSSPNEVREVAEYLGMVLRSTGKAKRGIGTIRQDLNISIKNGARIEIKGAQELRLLPMLVEYEVLRQKALLEIRDELKERKAASIKGNFLDVSELFKTTESKIIKNAIKENGSVYALRLPKFAGLLGKEVQPNKRFSTELLDYAKIKTGITGLFHSDELTQSPEKESYGISYGIVKELRDILKCSNEDGFVIVGEQPEKAKRALEAIAERASISIEKIPPEVRKVNEDGTTSFLRPMPGSARMYPETDIGFIIPDTEKIKVPKLIIEQAKALEELGIEPELAKEISKSDKIKFLEEVCSRYIDLEPSFIARAFIVFPKEIKTRFDVELKFDEWVYEEIFQALREKRISKDAVFEILVDYAKNNKLDLAKYAMFSDDALKSRLTKIVKDNPDLKFNALIGLAMEQLRGKADGKKIVDIIKELKK